METQQPGGRFIVFEGIDGSGKSTQARMLAEWMESRKFPYHYTFEPTKRPIGKLLRDVLTGKLRTDEATIAALFSADRLDHLHNEEDGILKLLREGNHIICDRYYFSSYAYHSVHVPMDWVIAANALAAQALRPDVVLFLDVSPARSMARARARGMKLEHYEQQDTLEKVRANYLEAFERTKEQENIRMVDADRSIEAIQVEIRSIVEELLGD